MKKISISSCRIAAPHMICCDRSPWPERSPPTHFRRSPGTRASVRSGAWDGTRPKSFERGP
eukprot:1392959-Prorocentrum_lima.AAC.1